MRLAAGTKLEPYEIVALLGTGGMGEVYRARDSRLRRDVALKVLPEAFVGDPQRMARFEREAQFLAALNHPNIASIYGLEESGGVRALVMEVAEGPTLAERIKRGPLTPEEALPLARQIADALEYAHERGIVHRDLKPANVKLTPEGSVKILDFGLAKAVLGESAAADVSASPTLSYPASQAGIILGTAAYMSPEQAKGAKVDRRADIWAFGCILFEMLAGRRAFEGETVSETLAAILRGEPDWSKLSKIVPADIRTLLERCLRKDIRSRLQSMGDARIALEEHATGLHAADSFKGRFNAGDPHFSPDGRYLAYSSDESGRVEIYVRPYPGSGAITQISNEGGDHPTWSRDGRELFYIEGEKLMAVTVGSGSELSVGTPASLFQGTFSDDVGSRIRRQPGRKTFSELKRLVQ